NPAMGFDQIRYIKAMGTCTPPPFSPAEIGGLKLWLKADALALNNNDPVSTWTDSSGNGNSPTSSGTKRPTYKTNVLNGKPVVRFDGIDDHLDKTFVTGLISQPSTAIVAYDVGRPIENNSALPNRQIVLGAAGSTYQSY